LRVYADTSFLVSLYSPDANSVLATRTMQVSQGDRLLTTLAELEFINALQLRIFRKELSNDQAKSALQTLESDLQNRVFQLIPLPGQAFERARQLSMQTTAQLGTRTADLLHVAAALELNVDYLYSFDQQQRKLAQKLRLKLN
jgi:predicted nucleic acid-binding protein